VSRRRHRDASPDNGFLAAFHRAARSPERWLDTAERLGRVADAVGRLFESDLDAVVAKEPITEHRHAQSGPAFMMLAGLAGAVSGPDEVGQQRQDAGPLTRRPRSLSGHLPAAARTAAGGLTVMIAAILRAQEHRATRPRR